MLIGFDTSFNVGTVNLVVWVLLNLVQHVGMQGLKVYADFCADWDGDRGLVFVFEPLVGQNLLEAIAKVRIRNQNILD